MPLTEWADPIAGDARQQGAHMLEVTRYSHLLHRRRGVGSAGGRRCVESVGFTVGGYQWAILFYPDGDDDAPGSSGYVSVSLALVTRPARVRASFNLGLVNRATGLPSFQPEDTTAVFNNATCFCCRMYPYPYPIPTCRHERKQRSCHGVPRLMRRCELEASSSAYLRDDAVTVACVVTGVTGTALLTSSRGGPEIRVPGRDLHLHIGELLVSQEGADVTFDVDGEAFAAHRIILAARSPVFEAELYGSSSTTETDAHTVTVRDMRPDTFRALLHFIYTDSLPAMSHLGMDEMRELLQHLLAAADRYATDRLKVMCEHILARTLHVENAAITLALADRHDCDRLKHASIHFMASFADKSEMGDDVAIEALEKIM